MPLIFIVARGERQTEREIERKRAKDTQKMRERALFALLLAVAQWFKLLHIAD